MSKPRAVELETRVRHCINAWDATLRVKAHVVGLCVSQGGERLGPYRSVHWSCDANQASADRGVYVPFNAQTTAIKRF